ncbi:MAG: DUF3012 domain-containing protein [Magnetococcales bacterium]|nr:DUF3012 domain-containing protein [Magnetococcales bacterium]
MRKSFSPLFLVILALATLTLGACSDPIGSPGWCENMKGKSQGEMSANDIKHFDQHCY